MKAIILVGALLIAGAAAGKPAAGTFEHTAKYLSLYGGCQQQVLTVWTEAQELRKWIPASDEAALCGWVEHNRGFQYTLRDEYLKRPRAILSAARARQALAEGKPLPEKPKVVYVPVPAKPPAGLTAAQYRKILREENERQIREIDRLLYENIPAGPYN